MTTASPVEHIRRWSDEFTDIRRDLHAHPELGFEEHRTARLVCDQLVRVVDRASRRRRPHRHRRRHSRTKRRERTPDRLARRHGRAADAGGERRRVPVPLRRPHARLRPRRPHDDAARGGALSERNAQFRRHRVPDLPAGRGRPRRREGDDRRRTVRALSRRTRVRAAQLARACRRAASASRPVPRWRLPTGSRS